MFEYLWNAVVHVEIFCKIGHSRNAKTTDRKSSKLFRLSTQDFSWIMKKRKRQTGEKIELNTVKYSKEPEESFYA